MNRKTLSTLLAIATMALALCSWWSVSRAIGGASSSTWTIAIGSFFALFVCLSLSIVLIKNILPAELLLLGVMALSFAFAPNVWHLAFIGLGLLFAFIGAKRVRRDMELNVKIDLWKSLQMGRSLLIIGFAIVITSQYYFTLQKNNGQGTAPHLETGTLTGRLSTKMLAYVNPNYKALDQEGITIDQFILQTQKNQAQTGPIQYTDQQADAMIDQQFGKNISDQQRQDLRRQIIEQSLSVQQNLSQSNTQLVLQEGRAQLSQMAGKSLAGTEKMSDVFSGFIDKKINDYFSPSVDNPGAGKLLPLILAGILFFTVWPLGSFLSIFFILLAYAVFLLFVRLGAVTVRKIPVEMEVLE